MITQAINVTPYIDILLVLLIIFMVITPFTSHGIPVRLPADPLTEDAPPPPGPFAIVLEAGADGAVAINGRPVTAARLEPELQALMAQVDRYQVFLCGGPGVFYGDIIRLADRARAAGVDQPLALMLRMPSDGATGS
ncbi:MAG TPA: biopolymer transporter ExbD [Acidobacteriota bacterium]|nr:biopolymer transporter ExbD [Acidobacteriota bacterium]HQM64540.1 biopolymer transporter ExbD [Acidobacteriota bacterium]